jgi:deazaflavin-dependent oxidoreductase (nitroreductase family)
MFDSRHARSIRVVTAGGWRAQLMSEIDATADYCYITTTGRVTGKPHTVEIWFGAAGSTLYVLAGSGRKADFVRNAIKTPAVAVRIGTRRSAQRHATARIVTDAKEDALARKLLLAKYATHDDLDEWGRTALPVAFDLAP